MPLTTLGRVARNSIAMTCALMIKRVAHFMIYILIARHLGVQVFGQFSLVYAFYLIFQVPAIFGLGNLIVREVAKDRSQFSTYLVNGHLIVLLASVGSLGVWIAAAYLLGYSPEVIKASIALGLALIPFSMSKVCESIFQAFERMQFIVYTFAMTNIFFLGLLWLLLSQGFGLVSIMLLLVIIETATLLVEWWFIYRYFPRPIWSMDLRFCGRLARASVTFLGISIFAVIFMRLNVIVLSKLRGETDVGLYNAAFQLSYVFMLISMSLQQALFPVLSRTYQVNRARFKLYTERAIEFLSSLSIPLAILFFFLADTILLVYRKEFLAAAPAMRILGWILIPLNFERILGGVLLATNHQRANLNILIATMASLGLFSFLFIHSQGLVGAATAMMVSLVVSFALHYAVVRRKVFPLSIAKVIWRPAASGLCLGFFILLVRPDGGGMVVAVLLGLAIYTAVLLLLNHLSGGPLGSWKDIGLRWKSEPQMPETQMTETET